MPALEAQAVVDNSELPHQEKIQLFEGAGLQQQQLAQQQFEQDTHAQTMASIHIGKRPLPPNDHDLPPINNDQAATETIQTLREEAMYLKTLMQTYTSSASSDIPKARMQVHIATPGADEHTKSIPVDELQGPNDPFQAALGHDDLQNKVHGWAMEICCGCLASPVCPGDG